MTAAMRRGRSHGTEEPAESAWIARTTSVSYLRSKLAETESEDAVGCRDSAHIYAIADGATLSAFAGHWAQLLVDHACENGLPRRGQLDAWLKVPNEQWDAARSERAGEAWWSDPNRTASATFLGAQLSPQAGGQEWRFAMIGDCCAFLLRRGELILVGPITRSADFDFNPRCLSSGPSEAPDDLREKTIPAEQGDVLILATDALAEWILRRLEERDPPWTDLRGSQDHLASLFDREREARRMKNDDVSFIVISLERAPADCAGEDSPITLLPSVEPPYDGSGRQPVEGPAGANLDRYTKRPLTLPTLIDSGDPPARPRQVAQARLDAPAPPRDEHQKLRTALIALVVSLLTSSVVSILMKDLTAKDLNPHVTLEATDGGPGVASAAPPVPSVSAQAPTAQEHPANTAASAAPGVTEVWVPIVGQAAKVDLAKGAPVYGPSASSVGILLTGVHTPVIARVDLFGLPACKLGRIEVSAAVLQKKAE
jgi:hypothetical protein